MIQYLPIPDGAQGRHIPMQIASSLQAADFTDKTLLEHRDKTHANALVQ